MTGECRTAPVRPRLSGAASGTAVPHVGGLSARRGGACRPRQPSHRAVQLMGARTAAAVSEGLGRTAPTSSPTMIDIEGILLTSKNGGCRVGAIIQQRTWTNGKARNRLNSLQSLPMQLCALETHIRNEKSQVWPRTLSMPPSGPRKRPKNLRKSLCGLQWLCVTPARHVEWLARVLTAPLS